MNGPAAAAAGKKEETLAGRRLSLIDEAEEQLEQGLLLSYSLRRSLAKRLQQRKLKKYQYLSTLCRVLPVSFHIPFSVVDPDPCVLGLQDPDPSLFVRIRIWIRILPSSSRKSRKNLGL